ncbi:MAG TPA: AraC family transcriptional regulator [Thermoanaerobaculia bacterium]|nr:AraC family transcriptional regulator [Thermoanaerobaculia bacterium]
MPLDVHLKPVESLLFRSDVLAIGKFRCPSTHPLFRDSGPCSHHTFVFPRTMTQIRYADGPTITGNPSALLFYKQDQIYFRTKISDVDASDWYTVADDVLFEILDTDKLRSFVAPVSTRAFLAQRQLFDALDRGETISPLHIEETVLSVLGRRVYSPPLSEPSRIEHVQATIAKDISRNHTLRELARSVELSPFALCRAFRKHTGETLTRFRDSLRLRLSLDRLRDRSTDITQLALDLGYASHSHFTARFRRCFGMTPSAFRAIA